MLVRIVEKEVLDHLLSVRFVCLLALCLLLLPASFYVNFRAYQNRYNDYLEIERLDREEHRDKVDYFRVSRPPSHLSVFAGNLEDVLPRHLKINREGWEMGPSAITEQSSVLHAFETLDFMFLIKIVFSLLGVLFAFDLICGEKEAGTLRLLLSFGVPRDKIILGKFIGGYGVLVVPIVFSTVVGLAVLAAAGFDFSGDTLPRVMLMLGVSLLYLSIFFCLGLFVSACLQNAKTSLVVLLLCWILMVLVLPRAGSALARVIRPVRTAQAVQTEKKIAKKALEREQKARIRQIERQMLGGVSQQDPRWEQAQRAFVAAATPLALEYESRRQQRVRKLNQAYQIEVENQERLGVVLARISPAFSYTYVTANLASTGMLDRKAYFTAAAEGYVIAEREVYAKQALQKFVKHQPGPPRLDGVPPKPEFRRPDFGDVVGASAVDFCLLAVYNVLFFAAAYVKFLRYDVR